MNNEIFEDYFSLQKKTLELEKRLEELEGLIIVEKEERYKLVQLLKTVDSRRISNISNISNYQNYQRYYTYYKNAKIVIGALFFFFGKQILSHPNFYKIIFTLLNPLK